MTSSISDDCVIPASVSLEPRVTIGMRVIFVGGNTIVRAGTTIETACVIGADVTIGQGALIRAGSVVLRSIPPNAIVEGNPAKVVGYRTALDTRGLAGVTVSDIKNVGDQAAFARQDLGVGGSALYSMRRVIDTRGSLTVGEVDNELPFKPLRYFIVFDVPSSELRGEHAHKACHQFLLCTHGSCRVLLDDGSHRTEVTLDRPDIGVYMPPMIWGTQYRYSKDAVLLVFASHVYDGNDYLRTYEDFLSELEKSPS